MVNTQTLPKPDNSQKTMVQYSNRAKACHLSEKDGTILKQSQNLIKVGKKVQYSNRSKTCHRPEKDGTILKQCSNRAKTCHQSKKGGAILKQCQNLLTVRKRWYNTQTGPKPANSQYR